MKHKGIRALITCKNVPMLAMTAIVYAEDRVRCFDPNDHGDWHHP
jgi:hypothetical protein